MTIIQKRKVLERIVEIENNLDVLEKARIEAATSGYASATLSSSGGSKSYTRIDLDKITNLIDELTKKLAQYKTILRYGVSRQITSIATIYS